MRTKQGERIGYGKLLVLRSRVSAGKSDDPQGAIVRTGTCYRRLPSTGGPGCSLSLSLCFCALLDLVWRRREEGIQLSQTGGGIPLTIALRRPGSMHRTRP